MRWFSFWYVQSNIQKMVGRILNWNVRVLYTWELRNSSLQTLIYQFTELKNLEIIILPKNYSEVALQRSS